MKTFKDLKVGDKIYYIHRRDRTVGVFEISNVNVSSCGILFTVHTVIGVNNDCVEVVSVDACKIPLSNNYTIYSSEELFLKDLQDENI